MQTLSLERKILTQRQLLTWKCVCLKISPSLTQQLSEGRYLSSCILHVAMGHQWVKTFSPFFLSPSTEWGSVKSLCVFAVVPRVAKKPERAAGQHKKAPKIDSEPELTVATLAPGNIKMFCLA